MIKKQNTGKENIGHYNIGDRNSGDRNSGYCNSGFKGVLFEGIFEKYVEENEDHLMELWDEYKYENYCGEYFHHDDVDYFNEEQFLEMAELVFNGELE